MLLLTTSKNSVRKVRFLLQRFVMGLRMWLLEAETKEKNELKLQTETRSNLDESTITSNIGQQDDTADYELYPKSDNAIKKILNLFDGKVVDFSGLLREQFEERAGIMEFDGGLSRESAEAEAIRNILNYISYFGSG